MNAYLIALGGYTLISFIATWLIARSFFSPTLTINDRIAPVTVKQPLAPVNRLSFSKISF
ncbi:MAG TPA: hypothetical protein VFW42_03120 [Fluviicoccus sp.]|nr:hypothetical protein [Fluviicoccus sp.]